MDEAFFDELIELRTALAEIKNNAEQYIKQSKSTSAALHRLTQSLNVLRDVKLDLTEGASEETIYDLNLSVRASRCLESEGIAMVRDLCKRTADELLEFRNFGETTLREVEQKLAERGLKLRSE